MVPSRTYAGVRALIKKFGEPALPPRRLAGRVRIALVAVVGLEWPGRSHRRPDRQVRLRSTGPLDHLVELASIEPDAATRRAIINFDARSFGHDQIDGLTGWTFHGRISVGTAGAQTLSGAQTCSRTVLPDRGQWARALNRPDRGQAIVLTARPPAEAVGYSPNDLTAYPPRLPGEVEFAGRFLIGQLPTLNPFIRMNGWTKSRR